MITMRSVPIFVKLQKWYTSVYSDGRVFYLTIK
jgi:hypothetical protein